MRKRVTSLVFVVALAVAGVSAALVTDSSPYLGLDLQGGISVVLAPTEEEQAAETDEDNELDDRLDEAVSIIRERVDGLGVAEPEINRQGDAIVVQLPGVDDRERVLELVGSTAELRFRPVISTAPSEVFHAEQEEAGDEGSDDAEGPGDDEGSDDAGDEGSEDEGAGDEGSDEGDDAAADDGSDEGDADEGDEAEDTPPGLTTPEDDDPDEVVVLEDKEGEVVYTLGPMLASGQIIRTAQATTDDIGRWFVGLSLRSGASGNDLFNEAALACYNRLPDCPTGALAIVLDGEVQSAPSIEQPSFDGSAQITGEFTQREAQDLALVLRYGALPVELERQSFETVSASLGEDSLQAGIVAGAIGLLLVALYMLAYYRALGAVVIVGMGIWAALMYAVVSWLGVTQGLALTLAGVTGIIISVGVTVDSYVVYFERLKDEVKLGRSLRASADRAFKAAFRTILAANVATLIGAGVLWWWTVGAVRGFAFFLGLSGLLGLLVTVTYTRSMVSLLARNRFFAEARAIGVGAAMAEPEDGLRAPGRAATTEPVGGTS